MRRPCLCWLAPVLVLGLAASSCGTASDAAGGPNDAGDPETAAPFDGGNGLGASVLQHHNHASRDGVYTDGAMTKAAAAKMKQDPSFRGALDGNVYGQPLYLENGPGGKGTFFVATENNVVHALDEATGSEVWRRDLGPSANSTGAGCGNISPLGVTGTPVIDASGRTLFVDAVIATGPGGTIKTHEVHALSIDDGKERAGWPFDVSRVSFGGLPFNPVWQNQRGALSLLGTVVYVPFGGHSGDCPHDPNPQKTYHGWVVGVPIINPAAATAWATQTGQAGIWAPGGTASDGTSIFAATGNGNDGSTQWHGSEAIVRLSPDVAFSGKSTDYFSPTNFVALDNTDADLGGTGPIVFDVPGATPSKLIVAMGKDGAVYLLDRDNLGGLGGPVAKLRASSGEIINAGAAFTTAGGSYIAFVGNNRAVGSGCPAGTSGDLVVLKVSAAAPPQISVAWCASAGEGSPAVTTTDGKSEAIVWVLGGGRGDGKLRAFDAETGAPLLTTPPIGNARHWVVPIAVHGRILVAGDGQLPAFRPE